MTAETETPPERTGLRGLLAVRDARLYFSGLAISLFGDNVLLLASGIWVKDLTGNNGAAALIMFFVTAPALVTPLLGVLADRVRRRTLMMSVNAAMAVASLCLLLVRGDGQVWLVYLVMLCYGVAIATLGVAESGLFVAILPERLLGPANSVVTSLQESMKVVAPTVGAALFVWLGGPLVGFLNALTFATAFLALALLRVREPVPEPSGERPVAELAAGFRWLTRAPGAGDLRGLVYAGGAVLLVMGFTQTAMYGLVEDGLHRSPAFLGVLVSAQGIGSVLGGLAATGLVDRFGERRFAGAGVLICAVGTALLAVPSLAVALPAMALRGIGLPWLVIGAYTLLQRRAPGALLGRAAAAVTMLMFLPQAVSVLTGAGLGELTGYQVLYGLAAGLSAPAGLYLLARRPVKENADV